MWRCLDNILVNCDLTIQSVVFDTGLSDQSTIIRVTNDNVVVFLQRPMPDRAFYYFHQEVNNISWNFVNDIDRDRV